MNIKSVVDNPCRSLTSVIRIINEMEEKTSQTNAEQLSSLQLILDRATPLVRL